MRTWSRSLVSLTIRISLWLAPASPVFGEATFFIRGDSNTDGEVDISDPIFTLGFLFLGNPTDLDCMDAADFNDDGDVDVSDAICILEFRFLGFCFPPPPVLQCGSDLTGDDDLGCALYPDCFENLPPPPPTFLGTVPPSPANDNNPEIRGQAEPGSTVRLYTTPDCSGPAAATGSADLFAAAGITVTVPDNSTTTFHATATDGAGNVSPCSPTGITYVEDSGGGPCLNLVGPADAPAIGHIPTLGFPPPDPAEFESLNDALASRTTILLIPSEAATVGEANALLASIDACVIGGIPGFDLLLARLPADTTIDQMLDAVNTLEADPRVAAVVMDLGGMQKQQLPPHNASPGLWTWEVATPPTNGNYGLKLIRAPQMWNLDTHVRRHRAANTICAGVVEPAPAPDTNHPGGELLFDAGTADGDDDHATMVSGIIAARWDNGVGVEGVAPGAVRGAAAPAGAPAPWVTRLYGRPNGEIPDIGATEAATYTALGNVLDADACVKVVNHSYGWLSPPACSPPSLGVMNQAGTLLSTACDHWLANHPGRDFIIISAAGNCGPGTFTSLNSAPSNAAGRFAGRFFNVEAINNANAAADFTSLGGSVSAPGWCIDSTESPGADHDDPACPWTAASGRYAVASGTSFAAPHVTGLIAALWKLDPALSVTDIRSLVTGANYTVNTSGGTQPRIDAFAAAMGIDLLRGNRTMQTALVDVDDGSLLDGNARIDADDEDGDGDATEEYDGAHVAGLIDSINRADRLRGDGAITMKDFRVFRDAVLQVLVEEGALAPAFMSLDGAPAHFKKDLNFDGCVFIPGAGPAPAAPGHPGGTVPAAACGADAPREGVYARYDFNGSGTMEPHGVFRSPPPTGVAPFKIDPDIVCSGLYSAGGGGCWRDLDVLVDPAFWMGHLDEEHITASRTADSPGECVRGAGWMPPYALLLDRNVDGVVDYFASADLHFIFGPDATGDYDNVFINVVHVDPPPAGTFGRCIHLNGPRAGKIRTILTVPLPLSRTVRVIIDVWDDDEPFVPTIHGEDDITLKLGEDRTFTWP